MHSTKHRPLGVVATLVLGCAAILPGPAAIADTTTASTTDTAAVIAVGKKLAFDRKKGNCLACHQIEGGNSPGNIGPPLVGMKARYPDKKKLRARVWDATVANPETPMPPFGRHQIVSEQDIDQIVEFIWSK
jgi:sulfur-oxidizing protein SoxX